MSLTQSCLYQPRSNGRNRKSSSSMLDDFDKASIVAHADENEYISPATPEPQPEPEFAHLTETKRTIHDAIAALNDDSFDKRIARLLPQYEGAIREEFEVAQYSPQRCRKLARILTGLTDVIHTIARSVRQDKAYRQRMCNIVAYYISCELCSAQEPVEKEEFIINRISSALKLYVGDGESGAGVHKEHVLRTLLAAPKLFNRASILSVLYSRLFPHWSMPSIMIQAELPDKLYIEYILIFYYWQRLEPDEAVKDRIVEFAEKFMRPSKTLATRSIYAEYLPKYSARGTATRSILNHLLQNSCTSLHVAIKVENRPPHSSEVVISSDDEDSCPLWSSVRSRTPTPSSSQHPPAFLQNLCKKARQLEPCKRASALFSGIDNNIEIVDLRDSDDDVEMFSLDFNVPANVDGNNSNSNSNDSASQSIAEDDSVPVTRIYPTNLRTYERGPSAAVISVPPTTYIVPRIVNSYSCRRDSLHLVSTTAPHLVDQSVQTTEDEEELGEQTQEADALPTFRLYSDNRLPTTTTTRTPDLLYSVHKNGHSHFPRSYSASSSDASTHKHQHVQHCRQPSSQNRNCSESSMQKKQVTFIPLHLGVTASRASIVSSKKPDIKRYETMPASKVDRIDTLKWMALKEHIQASAKMFAKLNANSNNCDKGRSSGYKEITVSPVRSAPRAAQITASQLTPTTSNASSCTPTRMRATPRGRGELPTPPASTHSSASPYQILRASTDTLSSIDLEKLEVNARVYSFNRRLFSKAANEHVSFYNQLLSVQRKNLRQRRLENRTNKSNLVDPGQEKLVIESMNRCHQLRALNASRRNEAEQLQRNLTAIKNYAMRGKPIVRLKRCNLNALAGSAENSQTFSTSSNEPDKEPCKDNHHKQKQEKLEQNQAKQRRRRGHSVWNHIKKKKKLLLFAADVASDTSAVKVPNPSPESDRGTVTEPDSKDPEPILAAAYNEPRSLPEVGMELEVQEDGLETDDTNAVASPAHNIELVTSNVPVYLLNGESRDVSTPLSSQFSSSGSTEPAAANDTFVPSRKD